MCQFGRRKVLALLPPDQRTWDALLDIYDRIYTDNEETFNRLVDFTVTQSKTGESK